jgi:hypothetical protein
MVLHIYYSKFWQMQLENQYGTWKAHNYRLKYALFVQDATFLEKIQWKRIGMAKLIGHNYAIHYEFGS